ncbi:hypothetical protein [Synechococcus sp. M16CYN]|uniref:hypothetical protein n=1 Tax=Synechococcus sp. M16CYN TaxID=3103139 RepID=UPI00333F9586
MIALIGLCIFVMTFLHWVVEPLELALTPLFEFTVFPWLLVGFGLWLLAAQDN